MLVLLALLGCPDFDKQIAAEEEHVQEAMGEHHQAATAALDAVIDADLAAVKRHAEALSGVAFAVRNPEESAAHSKVVGEIATLRTAKDLPGAALALGRTAQACGQCHQAAKVKPTLPPNPTPDWKAEGNEMLRHQWAMRSIWAGLLTGDDGAVIAAAKELGESPLAWSNPTEPPPASVLLEQQVHTTANGLTSADSKADWGRYYGEILATCAQCHELFRPAKK